MVSQTSRSLPFALLFSGANPAPHSLLPAPLELDAKSGLFARPIHFLSCFCLRVLWAFAQKEIIHEIFQFAFFLSALMQYLETTYNTVFRLVQGLPSILAVNSAFSLDFGALFQQQLHYLLVTSIRCPLTVPSSCFCI